MGMTGFGLNRPGNMSVSLTSLIRGTSAALGSYGTVVKKKDARYYVVEIGKKKRLAQWNGAVLVEGDNVIVSHTDMGIVILQKMGMPGDITPELQEIDP